MTGTDKTAAETPGAITPSPGAGSRVWASVVCFGATPDDVRPTVAVLEPQVERVLILDNSPIPDRGLAGLASRQTIYLPMRTNLGTAGAMNEACRQAIAAGANYLITFDQDSQPGSDLVVRLLASLGQPTGGRSKAAAIGPRKVDRRTGRPMRVLLPVRWRKHYAPSSSAAVVEVDHLISSGCLLDLGAFQEVGVFNEALFLDYVDIEWCLRARAAGYAVLCDPRISMPHTIGDRVIRLGPWSVWVHTPERNGLLVRNHLLLWRTPAIRASWLLSDLRQIAVKLAVQLWAAPPRWRRVTRVLRGIRDGLNGRGGPA